MAIRNLIHEAVAKSGGREKRWDLESFQIGFRLDSASSLVWDLAARHGFAFNLEIDCMRPDPTVRSSQKNL